MNDGRPAYAEIDDLARELPPTERAAVVLRYGYDLAYADIADRARLVRERGAPGDLFGGTAPAQKGDRR